MNNENLQMNSMKWHDDDWSVFDRETRAKWRLCLIYLYYIVQYKYLHEDKTTHGFMYISVQTSSALSPTRN